MEKASVYCSASGPGAIDAEVHLYDYLHLSDIKHRELYWFNVACDLLVCYQTSLNAAP
jgi:hypothetical protein